MGTSQEWMMTDKLKSYGDKKNGKRRKGKPKKNWLRQSRPTKRRRRLGEQLRRNS